ncbi:MAG: hypothetical protein ABH863_03245, partial [Candidatus Micrarchaeota archaeon]
MRQISLMLVCALALLSGFAVADLIQSRLEFLVFIEYTNVSISDVTVGSDPLYAGSTTDIYVSLQNGGTIYANVSINLTIYNATGAEVDNLSYAPASVPPLSILTVSSSWSSGALPVGTYYANASGTYENGTNATNEFSRQFQISLAPTPTPLAPPAGGGGSSVAGSMPSNVTPPTPTAIPPELKPVQTNVNFLRSTVLKEISAGTSAIESIVLKNIAGGTKSLTVSVMGAPIGWFSFTPKKTILLPNEERAINFAFTIPSDALPGDYLLRIDAAEEGEVATDYMVLRVKAANRGAQYPVVLKTIRLDRPAGATNVVVDVVNPSTKPVAFLQVLDEILPQLHAIREDIVFADKPAELFGNPLTVKWQFRELAPLERATVSYTIYKLLQEYRPYVYWSVKQVEISEKETKLSDIVAIREISSTLIGEGGEGDVYVRVFYAGFEPVNFRATLELPSGFSVSPLSIEDTLLPRGTSTLKFRVRAPFGSQGTHSATISVLLEDEFLVQQTGYVTVQQAVALSWQILLGAVLVAVLFVLSFLHYLGKKGEH